jgi:hypothetical protein
VALAARATIRGDPLRGYVWRALPVVRVWVCEMVSIIACGANFEAAINDDGQEDDAYANEDDQEYNIAR